jgi:hypothetical protein
MTVSNAARWIMLLALGAAACKDGGGAQDEGADTGTGGSEAGTDPTVGDTDDPPEVGCEGLRPARTPLRRLTDVQYRNTIEDLFAGAIVPSDDFPETSLAYEYTTEAAADEITELAAEQVMIAAEDVADQVMANTSVIVGCDLGQSCIESFVDDFGSRAFRRPIADDEREILLAAFADGESPTDGVGRIVAVALQMPGFLYLVEAGAGGDGDVVTLTDHELASRLSYLLWDTMPDEDLRMLADQGELADADALEEQARRLLADPRAEAGLGRFHREWLDLPPLRGTEKDPTMYPLYDAELVASMSTQFDRLVAGVVRSDDPSLTHLLTADAVEIDANLAAIYGVQAPASGWTELTLDPQQRAGILTTPLLLATHATQIGSSTTHRGKMVRTRILCQPIPPPPPEAAAQAPMLPPDATERERAEALLESAECGGCHSQMDGIGFGFENFDAIGSWRETYASGTEIDASGMLVDPPEGVAAGDFVGAVELAQRLAEADAVSGCYVDHFVHSARGTTPVTEVEACASEDLRAMFLESGQDLAGLVAAFVRSDGFRYRDVGDAP